MNNRRAASSGDALWWALATPMLLFLMMPLVALILRVSPQAVLENLQQPQVLQAIGLSLFTSTASTLVTLVFGLPVAYLLSRKPDRAHAFLDTLVDLPMVLPPSVAGIAMLVAFGRRGLLGPAFTALGIEIPFTALAVILAQTFVASPFFIKSAAAGLAGVSTELKQAAALDGARRVHVFRYVSLPLAGVAMLSGSVMTWARALGEFGATIIFAGNFPGRTQTMPLAIYLGFEIELNVALTLSFVLICASFLALLVVKGLLHGRIYIEP
jgi:molybdate transport system permease protein